MRRRAHPSFYKYGSSTSEPQFSSDYLRAESSTTVSHVVFDYLITDIFVSKIDFVKVLRFKSFKFFSVDFTQDKK